MSYNHDVKTKLCAAYPADRYEKECELYRQNDFFQINPPAAHAMFFPEDCVLVAMYDHAVENPDGTKDIIPA